MAKSLRRVVYFSFSSGETEEESQEEEKLVEKPVEKPTAGEKKGKEKSKPKTKAKDAATTNGNSAKGANGRDKQATKTPRRQSKKASKQKDSGEDWELDCEICGAKGKNQVRYSV